jgi:hypothetical protein
MQDPGLSSDDDEEDDVEQNALDVLMQPPSKKLKGVDIDPIMIAVVYIRWLRWIDPSEPLYMCPYGGQAVRVGSTANEVAAARWAEENSQAMRESKRVGLLHELKVHGATAFDNQVVEWKRGPRSDVQKWADEREIALIAEHGGQLRDPSARCKQTLNLTKGGKGNVNFEARDASRTVAWLTFQDEMEEYVECYDTSLVPYAYVNPVSGYKLGGRLAGVRQGELWRCHPDEAKRVEWLGSLPNWAWKAMKTDEWRQSNSEATKKQFESQEARDTQSERAKKQWANADDETRAEWIEKITEANNRPEVKEKHSDSAKAQAKREREADPEYRSRRANIQMTQPEALERQSRNASQWWQTSTPEQIDRMEANRKKTVASSRERRMEGMTESQRKSEVAKQESNQRKGARKKRQLLALRQVPGWEKAHNRDIPKARTAGVLPSID